MKPWRLNKFMVTPGNDNSEPPVRNDALTLILAFFAFLFLSAIFSQAFGFKEALKGPQIVFIMGINYIPLIFIPYFFAKQIFKGTSFPGLSFADFKRTLTSGIAVCIIAGIWQCGILEFPDVAHYPDWAVFPYIAAFPAIIIIAFFETQICKSRNWIPGFITLVAWCFFAYFFPTGDEEIGQAVLEAARNPMQFLLIAFLIGIFVPFAEEYFFRGYVLCQIRKRFSVFSSALITAVLFGFAHLGSPVALSLVLFAIVPGLMALHFKSIYPAIWAHVGLNISGMILISTMI